MMLASSDECLILALVDLPKLKEVLAQFTPITGVSSAIYRFPGSLPIEIQNAIGRASMIERRLFDRAHFLLNSDLKLQQAVYNDFFEYIAAEYESLIDLDHNLQNIENLVEMLHGLIGDLSGRRILDFGCGTGLACCSLTKSNAHFVGIDQSQHMREIAGSRGMKAFDLNYLNDAKATFDGVIASYVLHLVADETVVGALVSSMKPGATLVANHHKALNVAWAQRVFRSFGCDVLSLHSKTVEYGAYFAYVRR